jgi:hypothetical protein
VAQHKSEKKRDASKKTRRNRGRSPRSLGRRLATGIVVFALSYLIGVAFVSIIPQVFWPETADVDPSISCVRGLRELRGELLGRAGEHVARGGSDDPGSLSPWLHRWDLRHRALEARCGGPGQHDAWRELARLRERLAGTLARFDSEEGELARNVDQNLAHSSDTPSRRN